MLKTTLGDRGYYYAHGTDVTLRHGKQLARVKPSRVVELGLSRTGDAGFLTTSCTFQGPQHPKEACPRERGKAGDGDLEMLGAPPVLLVTSNQKIKGPKEPDRD